MPKVQPLPPGCPVELGFSTDSTASWARLHDRASKGKLRKVKRILSRGVAVDTQNNAGQSALFLAVLFGRLETAEFLLQSGANPNHRCSDGSTPVHAAAFSCKAALLLKLFEAGGDLRLHDREGRSPQDWADAAGKEKNAKVLQCLQQCLTQMALLFQCSGDLATVQVRYEVRNCLSLRSLRSLPALHVFSSSMSGRSPRSLGFGSPCPSGLLLSGLVASTPIAADIELLRSDSESDQTYENGPYSLMRNLLWRGQFVTVRELKQPSHPRCSKPHGTIDLLITEQQHCSRLHHPNLLLLIAVCSSPDLASLRLVYERVQVTSLYCLLHRRRSEFPRLRDQATACLLLQICEALMFLHSQGYVHRALNSHAVQVVTPRSAKLGNLEYMQPSAERGVPSNSWSHPIPTPLFNWLPPEVVLGRPASRQSDFYSFCTVLQETFTDTVPWNGADGLTVKEMMKSGLSLAADARVPRAYYHVLQCGLSPRERERTMTLQDVRYSLRSELKDTRRSSVDWSPSPALRHSVSPLYPILGPKKALCMQQDAVDGRNPVYAHSEHTGLPYYELDIDASTSSERHAAQTVRGSPPRTGRPMQCHTSARGQESFTGRLESASTSSSLESPEARRTQGLPDHAGGSPAPLAPRTPQSSRLSTDSDSSLVLETEHTLTEGEEALTGQSSGHGSPEPLYMNLVPETLPSAAAKLPLPSRVLPQEHLMSSLQESAHLLEKADTSLELLERHFLAGIGVLEEFASRKTLCSPMEGRARVQAGGFGEGLSSLLQRGTHGGGLPPSTRQKLSGETEERALSVSKVKDLGRDSHLATTGNKAEQGAGEDVTDAPKLGLAAKVTPVSLHDPVVPHRPPVCPSLKSDHVLVVRCQTAAARGIVHSQSEGTLVHGLSKSRSLPQPTVTPWQQETARPGRTTDDERAQAGGAEGGRRPYQEARRARSLSLQSIIDLTSRARERHRPQRLRPPQCSQDVSGMAVFPKTSETQRRSSETDRSPDRPCAELESINLMQEIINELNGAGEPALSKAAWREAWEAEREKRPVSGDRTVEVLGERRK